MANIQDLASILTGGINPYGAVQPPIPAPPQREQVIDPEQRIREMTLELMAKARNPQAPVFDDPYKGVGEAPTAPPDKLNEQFPASHKSGSGLLSGVGKAIQNYLNARINQQKAQYDEYAAKRDMAQKLDMMQKQKGIDMQADSQDIMKQISIAKGLEDLAIDNPMRREITRAQLMRSRMGAGGGSGSGGGSRGGGSGAPAPSNVDPNAVQESNLTTDEKRTLDSLRYIHGDNLPVWLEQNRPTLYKKAYGVGYKSPEKATAPVDKQKAILEQAKAVDVFAKTIDSMNPDDPDVQAKARVLYEAEVGPLIYNPDRVNQKLSSAEEKILINKEVSQQQQELLTAPPQAQPSPSPRPTVRQEPQAMDWEKINAIQQAYNARRGIEPFTPTVEPAPVPQQANPLAASLRQLGSVPLEIFTPDKMIDEQTGELVTREEYKRRQAARGF